MNQWQSNFGLFLFLFWLYHLLLKPTKLLLYIHGILTKQIWLRNQRKAFSCFFLLKWWSIFSRTFVYDTHTLEVVSDGIEFKMWIQYFECVFIIIILFSKNGVKNRLKDIFQTCLLNKVPQVLKNLSALSVRVPQCPSSALQVLEAKELYAGIDINIKGTLMQI